MSLGRAWGWGLQPLMPPCQTGLGTVPALNTHRSLHLRWDLVRGNFRTRDFWPQGCLVPCTELVPGPQL